MITSVEVMKFKTNPSKCARNFIPNRRYFHQLDAKMCCARMKRTYCDVNLQHIIKLKLLSNFWITCTPLCWKWWESIQKRMRNGLKKTFFPRFSHFFQGTGNCGYSIRDGVTSYTFNVFHWKLVIPLCIEFAMHLPIFIQFDS